MKKPDGATLNAYDAGQLLQKRREECGYSADDVVKHTTVTSRAYLSQLENGKVNPAHSKHLPSLARFLRMREEDVLSINPNLIVNLAAHDECSPTAISELEKLRRTCQAQLLEINRLKEYEQKYQTAKLALA